MIRFLKNWQVDLFAVPVTLNHKGREKAKSLHGILATLLFAGFIFWFIYTLGKQMLDKQNPNTITFDSFQEIPASIELNSETFPFAIGMQLPSQYALAYFKDEQIFWPIIKLLVFKNIENPDGSITKDRQIIDIDIEPCTLKHFGSASATLKNLPLSLLYCINPKQTHLDKIELAGKQDISTYKAFYIGIMKCQGPTCKPDDEVQEKLTKSWLNILYLQSAINPSDYENPNQRFMANYQTLLSPFMLKSGILRLNHLNVVDDNGWLFESQTTRNFVKVDPVEENLDPSPATDGNLYQGVFEMGQVTTTYKRQYTRLQTLLAQIQGSAATVILVLIIILRPYSQVKFQEVLINELFDIKMKKKNYANNANANAKNNQSRNKKKRTSLKGGKHNKASEQNPKSSKRTTQIFEMQIPKISSEEVIERNRYTSLESERPLQSSRERSEETQDNTTKFQSFQRLLSSIENSSPAAADIHKTPHSLRQRVLLEQMRGEESSLETTRKMSDNRLSLAIDKPEKTKLATLNNKGNDEPEPDSPRRVTDITFPEAEDQRSSSPETSKKDYETISPISPQSGLVALELVDLKPEEEIQEEETQEEEEDALNYESKKIDISIWEFFMSYLKKNEKTQEKLALLNRGMKNVKERMDILNIMKKFRELDKLKALLLEEDQLILFNAMPKAEIRSDETEITTNELLRSRSFSKRILKKSTFIEVDENKELLKQSFDNIQMKGKKSKIDYKLLELYQNMLLGKKS